MNGEELELPRMITPRKWPAPLTVRNLILEIERSRTKFPGHRYLLAALVEEVGELAEAMASGSNKEVYKEAIQVACIALRVAEEDDSTIYSFDHFFALVKATGHVARSLLQRSSTLTALSYVSFAVANMTVFGLKHKTADPTFVDITDEEAKP